MKENYITAFITGIIVLIIGSLFYQFCLHPLLGMLLMAVAMLLIIIIGGITYLFIGIKMWLFSEQNRTK